MPSNPFELVVASFFQSSAMLGVNKPFEQPLKLQFYQLLMIFSSWWSSASNVVSFWWCCFWWGASDDVSTSGALCLYNLFSSDASNFLLVDSIALVCSFRTYALKIDTTFLSLIMYTWTNISISNWQFLIPCYHQNSKGNVKHILFQQMSF